MDWTDGYIAELEYTHGFYRELSPAHLAAALLVRSSVPTTPLDAEFTYCELGCGHGFSTNVMAAAFPKATFYGVDFNPTHIVGAEALARDASLKNVTFLENSFSELKALNLPKFDFITLHGIYSWISPENRGVIVDFIKDRLKPGGAVYASYNCKPGWSTTEPLRRFMTEYAETVGGTITEKADKAISFVEKVRELKVGYLANTTSINARLESIKKSPKNYVVHEYFNHDWHPLYFADVAKEFSGAKLTFAASATPQEILDFLCLNPASIKLVAETTDPVMRETIRDFLTTQGFRKDIYARGKTQLPLAKQRELVDSWPFALLFPKKEVPQKVKFTIGEFELSPSVYAPILNLLETGPKCVNDLLEDEEVKAMGRDRVFQALLVLFAALQVAPVPPGDPATRKESTANLNRALLKRAFEGDSLNYILSPVAGTAIPLSLIDSLFLKALLEDSDPVQCAWTSLKRVGRVLMKDGKKLETEEENLSDLATKLEVFRETRVPLYKTLGIL